MDIWSKVTKIELALEDVEMLAVKKNWRTTKRGQ